ncbi:MAG: hypothetical protein JRJ19_16890, partial [Deltaproteobacteria bacterium]|nr:hypothetical protein [Deltaproteobacteria bacterium]
MESIEEKNGLDTTKLAGMLRQGGAVSKVLAGFEHRPGQVEMLEAVSQAFNSNGILAVEAGTGVGKSLAYGLPAAVWAKTEFERVVISSATINLQEQLLRKDLPLVGQVLGSRLNVVLVKGRGNYLCKRRLFEKTRQLTLIDPGEIFETLSLLRDWAETSQDGSRSDLPYPVNGKYWEQVASDGDACLGSQCPHRQECFFVSARQAAEKADILVVNHHLLLVNHHLLFADLALRRNLDDWSHRAVLPPFNRLILDEAHELEDAASSFFGVRITRFGVNRMLSRMLPSKKKGAGLLAELADQLEGDGGLSKAARVPDESKGSVAAMVEVARESYKRAFDSLQALTRKQIGSSASGTRVRLIADVFASDEWNPVQEGFNLAASVAKELAGQVDKLVDRFSDLSTDDSRLVEVQAWNRRILALAADSEHLISQTPDGFVRWIEGGRKGKKQVGLQSAPLDVSNLMNEALYDQMESVVLTSATLAVRGKFNFLNDRIGLDLQPEDRLQTRLVESPFDFAEQVRLVLPI